MKGLRKIADEFEDELHKAAKGIKTSLPFIRNPLPKKAIIPVNEIFQVIVMGGTFFHSARVKKTRYSFTIIESHIETRPFFKSKDSFLKYILTKIDPDVTYVCFNFAFPIEPYFNNGILDGKLIKATKHDTFKGLVGIPIGELLAKEILRLRRQKIVVSVANDTICLLLAGLTESSWDNFAAGILGTGMNFALFTSKTEAINLESGGFDRFDQTQTGLTIDAASPNPGINTYEKEISGAYLYQHFNAVDGITETLNDSKEVSIIAEDASHPDSKIARQVLKSSAQLAAAQIASITRFLDKDLTFYIEGSLFWHGWHYMSIVEKTVRDLVPNHKVAFKKIDDSHILGAAKLMG